MRRRFLLAAAAAIVAAWPITSRGQPQAPGRLGMLVWEKCLDERSAFAQALNELGQTWGKNLEVICRSADGDYANLQGAAAELVSLKVDAIAGLTHITAYAARQATSSIPIVMIASGDPVRSNLVSSLGRPGGNVTGLTYYALELVGKRLELLKEIVPHATRIAVLSNPASDHVFGIYRQDVARAAETLGLQLISAEASRAHDLDEAFAVFRRAGADGLLVLTDPMLGAQAARIVELAAQNRLPAMYWAPWFVGVGGLAAYSPDYDGMMRRAAYYVARVLKGQRPSDLPVEQPTTFQFLVNLRAAKSLGLTVPASILARADEVIE
jgi:putative tryptophan/tyrosine transport system substrate-binding protein